MKKYTSILFDVDNTLLDFSKEEKTALKKTLVEFSLPNDDSTISLYSEINARQWQNFENGTITKDRLKEKRFEILFETINIRPEADIKTINFTYEQNLSRGGILICGAKDTLLKLSEEGYKIYAVTNGSTLSQTNRLHRTGLDKIFDGIFISELIGFQKPKKEYFDYVFANIEEKDKSKILLVGDSLTSDIKGAVLSDIDSVWINPKNKKHPEDIIPTFEIQSVKDIFKLL